MRNCSLWIGGDIQHRFSPIQKERMMLSLSNSKRIVCKKNILKTKACAICSRWRKIPGSLLIYDHTEGSFYSDDNVKIYCFGNMRVYYAHYCVITPRLRSLQHSHIFLPHSSLPQPFPVSLPRSLTFLDSIHEQVESSVLAASCSIYFI